MSILSINENLTSQVDVKASIKGLFGESFQVATIGVQAIKLSTIYGVAYMVSEMSQGKTQLEYNPRNGQLGIKA